jgi:prepilin-type N-terminal cleavage/methylation domain-containing protein
VTLLLRPLRSFLPSRCSSLQRTENREGREGREGRGGFTLLELLLAVGLFSILILALLKLIDTSLTIWSRTDTSRELSEMGGAALDMLAGDLFALEGGKRGDLVADWRLFDLDRDGIEGAPAQRLRLVRHLGAAGLQRLSGAAAGSSFETFERGLVEVGWALLPGTSDDPDERALGTLVRGERLVGDKDTLSFFEPGFFGPNGKPVPGALVELTGGVLWFNAWFATQTTILHDGWVLGDDLENCASSWDAWNKARPDAEVSVFNRVPAGMPQAKDVPLLPRRVRVEIELERPRDLRFRTRLRTAANVGDATIDVRDGNKLPPVGTMILIDEEWMKIQSVNGERASVERGRRGTRAAAHAAETLLHHGWHLAREIPVDMTREDWDL